MRLRVAIAGASGRMGRLLIEQAQAAADLELVAALAPAGSAAQGQDVMDAHGRPSGLRVGTELNGAQVLIDFTRVEGTLAHVGLCEAAGCALVAGTTGFSDAQLDQLRHAATRLPLLWAPNTSLGVNVVMELLAQAASRLGPEYDVEIVEAHHRHKVDAPSGTALQMGEVIAQARGEALADVQTLSREGHTGARQRGRIGFATVRGGDIVGDHLVMFCGDGERIEIAHRSSSRLHYAQGALSAARFLAGRPAGPLYRMRDVVAAQG